MADITNSIFNIRFLDELASRKSVIHELNPLVKLTVTLIYLVFVLSFGKYEVSALIPFVFYPVVVFALSETPIVQMLKRVILVLPVVIGIGIFNPFLDTKIYTEIWGVGISGGWLSFASLIIKCCLTVLAGFLLIATTGMENIASALRKLHVPKIFVTQLLLTYRYIAVLLEEASQIRKAYQLRSPFERGVSFKASGSLLGQMLLRAFDRANRVYTAMSMRGFNGEYAFGEKDSFNTVNFLYLILWIAFFTILRFFNLPEFLGNIFTGVM